jgi:hypothetical protein
MKIIAFITVPHSGRVKGEYQMHSESKQPGAFLKYKIKVPGPFHELSFFRILLKMTGIHIRQALFVY